MTLNRTTIITTITNIGVSRCSLICRLSLPRAHRTTARSRGPSTKLRWSINSRRNSNRKANITAPLLREFSVVVVSCKKSLNFSISKRMTLTILSCKESVPRMSRVSYSMKRSASWRNESKTNWIWLMKASATALKCLKMNRKSRLLWPQAISERRSWRWGRRSGCRAFTRLWIWAIAWSTQRTLTRSKVTREGCWHRTSWPTSILSNVTSRFLKIRMLTKFAPRIKENKCYWNKRNYSQVNRSNRLNSPHSR